MTAVSRSLLIDRHEPWSRRRFALWRPDADLALLIGYPFSPLVQAAHRLARRRIPYVIDAGDPWVLTGGNPPIRKHVALTRSRHAERRMWNHAVGAIVTTAGQADDLRRLFPELRILVRPNGYQPVELNSGESADTPARSAGDRTLRLVHFGKMYLPRIDIGPLLSGLGRSKRWSSVLLRQHGEDAEGVLDNLTSAITVESQRPVPWAEAVSIARGFDLALVVGNQNPQLLPSKVIEYLTLPIPRLAVVGREEHQAIRDYVRGKPGWLVLTGGEDEPDSAIAAHLARDWSAESLIPPESESWPRVAARIGDFLKHCLTSTTSFNRLRA